MPESHGEQYLQEDRGWCARRSPTAAVRSVRNQVKMFTPGAVIIEHPRRVSIVVAAAHKHGPYNVC